jgi:ribonuclease HI
MKRSKGSTGKSRTGGKQRRPEFKAGPDEREALEDVLARLGIAEDGWDVVLLGDGSGSNWNREAGWASVSVERVTMERLVWHGAMNKGTVNFAEMMAYLQPLNWLASREEDRRKRGGRHRAYRVHVITDSDYCRATGSSANRVLAKNGPLWAVFDVFARQGFVLTWHWIPRDGCGLNGYCDRLSKLARLLTKKYNLQETMEARGGDGPTRTVYDINP